MLTKLLVLLKRLKLFIFFKKLPTGTSIEKNKGSTCLLVLSTINCFIFRDWLPTMTLPWTSATLLSSTQPLWCRHATFGSFLSTWRLHYHNCNTSVLASTISSWSLAKIITFDFISEKKKKLIICLKRSKHGHSRKWQNRLCKRLSNVVTPLRVGQWTTVASKTTAVMLANTYKRPLISFLFSKNLIIRLVTVI